MEQELGEKVCLSEEIASISQHQQCFAVNTICHLREFATLPPINTTTLILSRCQEVLSTAIVPTNAEGQSML